MKEALAFDVRAFFLAVISDPLSVNRDGVVCFYTLIPCAQSQFYRGCH